MAEENTIDFPKWISGSVLIAAIPSLIYYLSFGFEMGYYFYFRIPYDLISINIISIFPTIHILSISAIGLIYFYVYRLNSGKICLSIIILAVIYIGLSSIGYKCIGYKKIIEFVVSIFIGVVSIIFVIVYKRHWLRLELDKKYEYGLKSLIWIIALFLFIYSAFEFGRVYNFYKTKSIKNFRIYEANPEMIALRIYSDRLICAKFDRDNKTVDSTYVIINISGDSPVPIHQEKIGPLKPIKKFLEEKNSK